jgi:hypothetical protein
MQRLSIVLSLLAITTTAVEANDIEDFFKAATRGSSRRHGSYSKHGHSRFRQTAHRNAHDSHHGHSGHSRFDDRGYDVRRSPGRSSSFRLTIGVNNDRLDVARGTRVVVVPTHPVLVAPAPLTIPVPDPTFDGPRLPAPPMPVHPIPPVNAPAGHHSHSQFHYGEFIDCPVPLFTRVRVKDRDNIHPRAVDLVIAVKDPNSCHHVCTCCEKRSVFVPICVPPCPPRSIEVSRDGSRIELDYGDYEVDIRSRHGVITVDYDD